MAAQPIDVDSKFVSYPSCSLVPVPISSKIINVITESAHGSDYLPRISSKCVQCSYEAKEIIYVSRD